jgi:hypothetical protein
MNPTLYKADGKLNLFFSMVFLFKTILRGRLQLVLSILISPISMLSIHAQEVDVPTDAKPILQLESYWRFHRSWRKISCLQNSQGMRDMENLDSPPPPANWFQPDFNDANWPRSRGKQLPLVAFALDAFDDQQLLTGLVCMRGKFLVTDPAQVKNLYLELGYRGGVVVYLNGKEIVRKDLPEGEIKPETPALAYPDSLFLTKDGSVYIFNHISKMNSDPDLAERVKGRDRQVGPLSIALGNLQKGVNVLAIEIHRSDYHPSMNSWSGKNIHAKWQPCLINSVRLSSVGSGINANIERPTGIQVWNLDRNDRLTNFDFGDPNETVQPILLPGARNGVFSGQIAVGSSGKLNNLKVSASDLSLENGKGSIPSSALWFRYGIGTSIQWSSDGRYISNKEGYSWFDGLTNTMPAPAPWKDAVQLILVSVKTNKETPPGDYKGTVTVSADSLSSVTIPIQLHVANWVIPDPQDYRTYVGLFQSPTSVALQYKVPEWSEEHWKYLEKSFSLLGEVGNKLVHIPIAEQGQIGNDKGMVYFIRKSDGTFDYDFSIFDRYIKLAQKYFGKIDYAPMIVFHGTSFGTWKKDGEDETVTLLDPQTKITSSMRVPSFTTEESKKFWAPVLLALKSRLKDLGLENAMSLGLLSDPPAPAHVYKLFNEILPDCSWVKGGHFNPNKRNDETIPVAIREGGKVVLWEFFYGCVPASPSLPDLLPIWKYRGRPGASYFRRESSNLSLMEFRNKSERALFSHAQGVGRECFDYWPVISKGPKNADIYNRWPNSTCAQREPTTLTYSYPGPNGAEPTLRFEAFREGIQETEALIVLSEAADKYTKEIGPELSEKCRSLIRESLLYCHLRRFDIGINNVQISTNHYGWQDLATRIFETAAEVNRILKK